MKKQHLKLTDKNRQILTAKLSKERLTAKVRKRILGLLALDKGLSYQAAQKELGTTHITLSKCVFTPKSASWLNMIEVEFSALSKLSLNRRIPCMKTVEFEVLHFFKGCIFSKNVPKRALKSIGNLLKKMLVKN